MRNILSRGGREVLEEIAWSNVLLGFDFDGTLAPIVADPDHAAVPASTKRLLRSVVDRYPCVVISGRARADVKRRLHGIGISAVVGNHGMEPWFVPPAASKVVRAWREVLDREIAMLPGVAIEDKGLSLAVHYRQSRSRRAARAAILAAGNALDGVRVVGGKLVVNLLPAEAAHKGIAMLRERERTGCDTAMFVGDDDTDEDVFALDHPGRLLSIRVGRRQRSEASYYLPRQADIDVLLGILVAARSGPRA